MIPRTWSITFLWKRGALERTMLCADGQCLLSQLFFELIQFIVIRFSIDCIVRERNSFDGVPREGAIALGISHVINLPLFVQIRVSPHLLHLIHRQSQIQLLCLARYGLYSPEGGFCLPSCKAPTGTNVSEFCNRYLIENCYQFASLNVCQRKSFKIIT